MQPTSMAVLSSRLVVWGGFEVQDRRPADAVDFLSMQVCALRRVATPHWLLRAPTLGHGQAAQSTPS
jgi:hypothetical protein